ncbi:MAG: transcriptional regulator [Sphingopyxis sp.]|nr:MAG: transcriptional regulator [Sphingopyxis sp.]
MELTEVVALNIRRIRHERKLTQEELADKADLSARYVGKIEQGRVSPTISVIGRLAKALEIDPCDFLKNDHSAAKH